GRLLAAQLADRCHQRLLGPKTTTRSSFKRRAIVASCDMAQLASLSAGDVRTVVGRFGDLLDAYREVINRLNVYPVPDGDTGTNMSLTVASVVKELGGVPPSSPMADVCKAVSHGSLMGARGNSGVILSQLLRGIAETLRDHEVVLPAT